jgi:hypothetical protein
LSNNDTNWKGRSQTIPIFMSYEPIFERH